MKQVTSLIGLWLLVLSIFISGCSKKSPESLFLEGTWNLSKYERVDGNDYRSGEHLRQYNAYSMNPQKQLRFNANNQYESDCSCNLSTFIIDFEFDSLRVEQSGVNMMGNGGYSYNESSKELTFSDGVLKGVYQVKSISKNELVFGNFFSVEYADPCFTYKTQYQQNFYFTR